jgi:hypothetical protein
MPPADGFKGLEGLEYCVPKPEDDHAQTAIYGETHEDAANRELSVTNDTSCISAGIDGMVYLEPNPEASVHL